MNRAHVAMSPTLDHTDPAGPTTSTGRFSTGRIVPSISMCGVATFGFPSSAASVASVPDIPRGPKIRVRRNVAHGTPDAASTTSPATAYMMFW